MIESLPNEIILHIFKYLEVIDLFENPLPLRLSLNFPPIEPWPTITNDI